MGGFSVCSGPQIGLGWLLAVANVALAIALFAEPVLFGRIIDTLSGAQDHARALDWPRVVPLIAAWVGFGLFMIVCGALVALFADRLAHQRRQAVLTGFFEHVLQLPLSFHSATHSGRVMKVMLAGTDTLWGLWLGFFREDLAALAAIAVLLPMSLYLNWRLGLVLIGLCLIFVVADGHRSAQDRGAAKIGGALLFGPRRTRLRHARQCRAGAELHPRRGRDVSVSARLSTGCLAPRCRCCPGGPWSRR